ncbi:MAG: DUF3592 domain-containing protein [Oleiphilaceae bacterium]|nr:DUF3592 domain-containing protein [Oleiphilaceae bacterium]
MEAIRSLFTRCLAWLMIVVASFSLLMMPFIVYEAISSRSWPEVSSTIVTSEVYKYKNRFCPRVLVDYQANEIQYKNKRISLSIAPCSKSEPIAAKKLSGYEKGSNLSLFYKPSDPEVIKLERGAINKAGYIFAAVALLFFPMGIGSLKYEKKITAR